MVCIYIALYIDMANLQASWDHTANNFQNFFVISLYFAVYSPIN